jgi:hypothetical protein
MEFYRMRDAQNVCSTYLIARKAGQTSTRARNNRHRVVLALFAIHAIDTIGSWIAQRAREPIDPRAAIAIGNALGSTGFGGRVAWKTLPTERRVGADWTLRAVQRSGIDCRAREALHTATARSDGRFVCRTRSAHTTDDRVVAGSTRDAHGAIGIGLGSTRTRKTPGGVGGRSVVANRTRRAWTSGRVGAGRTNGTHGSIGQHTAPWFTPCA